jgi:hypothetical protein
MKRKVRHTERRKNDFLTDYNNIVRTTLNPISLKNEWTKKGDIFQKFTMYDNNYKIIPNLNSIGSTTLIKKL